MALQCKLQERIGCAEQLLQRAQQLSAQRRIEGDAKLCSKLRAELRFLLKVQRGEVALKESHLHSTNLTHLDAVVQSAESVHGVVGLLHVFAYEAACGAKRTLVVDVVADGGHTWVKAIGRKAEALHSIWQGQGQYGDRSVVSQAEQFVLASHQQPLQYSHPRVVFAFYNGVSRPVAECLRVLSVAVRGDIVAVNSVPTEEEEEEEEEEEQQLSDGEAEPGAQVMRAEEEDEEELSDDGVEQEGAQVMEEEELSPSRVDRDTVVERVAFPTQLQVEACQRVNLDVTTLIALVSSLSHGRCRLRFREAVLTEQAMQERQCRVLPLLEAFMQDKELYACSAAVGDFQQILDTLGGAGEKSRARQLLARVRVVADHPSERTQRLRGSAKVNARSLMIFGTGDSLQAVTMTANGGFVRAAANQGVRYSVFIHQPRALTEGKEWRATPI